MPEVHIPGVGTVTFPYDMPPEQIAAQAQRLYAEAQGKEPSLTRERQPAGAPSALGAKHHPDTLSGGRHADALRMIDDAELPSDAAFLKRGPEVGGAAGMVLGGPLGAAAGAGLGSLVKGQHARGAHMPTGGEMTSAAGEGALSGVLAGAPMALARTARTVGPAVAKHAAPIAKGISALTGIGSGIASGNPLAGLGAAAATRMVTDPRMVRGAGNLAARAGNAIPEHVAQKAGFGALSAEAFRKALLEALGEDPASAVP
jgi:hypothetical protein